MVSNNTKKTKEKNEKQKPDVNSRIKPEFIVDLKGNNYAKYPGLVDVAHQDWKMEIVGVKSFITELIQFPSTDNGMTALCQTTLVAYVKIGDEIQEVIFSDIGDANKANTGNLVSVHIIRMASTRSKARVLRDFTNCGMTAEEELGDSKGDNSDDQTIQKDKVKCPKCQLPMILQPPEGGVGPPEQWYYFCQDVKCDCKINLKEYKLAQFKAGDSSNSKKKDNNESNDADPVQTELLRNQIRKELAPTWKELNSLKGAEYLKKLLEDWAIDETTIEGLNELKSNLEKKLKDLKEGVVDEDELPDFLKENDNTDAQMSIAKDGK